MKHTEEAPMQANVRGTVVVVYNGATSDELANIKGYLQDVEYIDPNAIKPIACDNCDMDGFYLSEELYTPDNIEKVHRTLWVLEDVLGNTDIDKWADYTSNTMEIDVVGLFKIHTGYQHLDDVTLKVWLIEQA